MDSWEFEMDGRRFRAEIVRDEDHGAPWEEEDGHGPVSDWTARDKRPGELVLNEDRRGEKRFYDFAAACRRARAEGWGFLPGRLEYVELAAGDWIAHVRNRSTGRLFNFEGRGEVNAAIRAVYAQHRATFPSARAYAAAAAMADYDRLRAWCNDDWCYVGVIVTPFCACCDDWDESRAESLWGIESDATDYLRDVAEELAEQIADSAAAA